MALDRRLNAFREDLADTRLASMITAAHYAVGIPARIRTGCVCVRPRPDEQTPCETFYHCGERVRIFERGEGYSWCQSNFDGYVGYVKNEHIDFSPHEDKEFYIITMGSYVYDVPDMQNPAVDFLPRHARIRIVASDVITRNTSYVRMDEGGYLPASCVADTPARSADLTAAVEKYIGCPYLWGGKSFLGIDCSGLIQSAFRDLGITVLRDTDMQRETIGEMVHIQKAYDLQRGDLLFTPGHVVLYAGTGNVIHADGKTMMVRRQALSEITNARGITDIVVRRTAKLQNASAHHRPG